MLCMGIKSGERRERQGNQGFRDRPWAKVWKRSSEEVRAEAVLSFGFYPGQQPDISSQGNAKSLRAGGHSFIPEALVPSWRLPNWGLGPVASRQGSPRLFTPDERGARG